MLMLAGMIYCAYIKLTILLHRNIGVIYESLRDFNIRPAIFGAPKEGELDP
jgi:hypothetical protein